MGKGCSRFYDVRRYRHVVLTITSKTGQSVARINTHTIFLFGFLCQREDILRHFIGIISDSRPKRALEIEHNK